MHRFGLRQAHEKSTLTDNAAYRYANQGSCQCLPLPDPRRAKACIWPIIIIITIIITAIMIVITTSIIIITIVIITTIPKRWDSLNPKP